MPDSLVYGPHPDQVINLYRNVHAKGKDIDNSNTYTIVLVHGGYWRERLTFELMLPLVPLWTREGANVANVEYRRGPAAPWPLPLQDVQEAMYTIREHVPGNLIGVGHSVGGQLALLLNTGFDAVVALAPVTDVVKVYYAGLGEEAAAEYFQTSPGAQPGLFASASPINHSLGP